MEAKTHRTAQMPRSADFSKFTVHSNHLYFVQMQTSRPSSQKGNISRQIQKAFPLSIALCLVKSTKLRSPHSRLTPTHTARLCLITNFSVQTWMLQDRQANRLWPTTAIWGNRRSLSWHKTRLQLISRSKPSNCASNSSNGSMNLLIDETSRNRAEC